MVFIEQTFIYFVNLPERYILLIYHKVIFR